MAVALRNTASANNAGGSSIACNIPTGTVAGDLLLANIIPNAGTTLTITMTGWTALPGFTVQTNNNTVAQYLYYRIATGTEGASVTVGYNTSPISSINIAAYSGVDNNNPFAGIAQSTSTTSTTVTFPAATPKAESVYAVALAGTRNVTSTNTVSVASSGFNVSADTCSSAASFVQAFIEDTHTVFGLPLTAVTPGTATITPNTANQCRTTLLLRADISSTTTPTIDYASFQKQSLTNPYTFVVDTGYAEVLIVSVSTSSTTISSITGASLTWTQAAASNSGSTNSEIWWAYSASPLVAQTITITWSGSTSGIATLTSYKSVATSPIGNNSTGAGITQSVTTTANNSAVVWVVGMTSYSTPTAATSNTFEYGSTTSGAVGAGVGHSTTVVASSGTSFAAGISAPTGKTYGTAAVEILAALSSSLPRPSIVLQAINRSGTF